MNETREDQIAAAAAKEPEELKTDQECADWLAGKLGLSALNADILGTALKL